jgi:hypothetical protein
MELNVHMPEILQTTLVIKVGKPFTTTRSTLGRTHDITLVLSEGYSTFRGKVSAKVRAEEKAVWDCNTNDIFIKPVANATQIHFVAMAQTDDELFNQLSRIWKNAARRKNGCADF